MVRKKERAVAERWKQEGITSLRQKDDDGAGFDADRQILELRAVLATGDCAGGFAVLYGPLPAADRPLRAVAHSFFIPSPLRP